MTISQGEFPKIQQLTLDFNEGFVVPEPTTSPRNVTRTIVFPKHIDIPNFGQFQRQVNLLFAPLGIFVEFRLTRQSRLEMKWVFPAATKATLLSEHQKKRPFDGAAGELSSEELKAFESVVFALAGTH
jgi:hypothetical protein